MRYYCCVIVLLGLVRTGRAQSSGALQTKPLIDSSVFGKWPELSTPSVSNDGAYVNYEIRYPAAGRTVNYIRSLKAGWQMVIGPNRCTFTSDSKFAIFKRGDSLILLRLGDTTVEGIPDVVSFGVSPGSAIVVFMSKSTRVLHLRDLGSRREFSYGKVSSYKFSPDGKALLMTGERPDGAEKAELAEPANGASHEFWAGAGRDKAADFVFSKSGMRLAFTVTNGKGKSVWWYSHGDQKAQKLADEDSPGIDSSLSIDGIDYRGFTEDGDRLIIHLKERPVPATSAVFGGVDVWSYRDARLQSEQLKHTKPKTFLAVIGENRKVVRLEMADDQTLGLCRDYALVATVKGIVVYDEWYWNTAVRSSVFLVSLVDGRKKMISDSLPGILASSYLLSPQGKYVIYYNAERRNYYSYEIATGVRRNITRNGNIPWTQYNQRDIWMGQFMPVVPSNAGWLKDDRAVLLYGQSDIFQADPAGKSPLINLTNGLGDRKNIEFRLAIEEKRAFNSNEKLVVSAFDRRTKADGFYEIQLGSGARPRLLTMQPCMFKGTWEDDRNLPFSPIKARDTALYLVRRMRAEEAPNYFWTTDFSAFVPLTDLHPEKAYNWLTTELISWKLPDGSVTQGVLYKPENFDPGKKYPLIIQYYERETEGLHGFIYPEFSRAVINVPFYVSNGYLVLMPDIHYQIGHPGKSVLNTVVSAAKYLGKLSFVDAKHIGIQGHSRGGWETNFLVTHSPVFAAATSASGFCNYTALYDGIRALNSGSSRQTAYETSYQRIGATLWQRPDLYLENSPIFKADRVTTPLLMMANTEDSDVPFEQGVEFFTALRRLGKKVWMLQYDGQSHVVFGNAARDFTIRMKQFFDFYLQNAPAPKWMVEGIPANLKGRESGLELEPVSVRPGPGISRASSWQSTFGIH